MDFALRLASAKYWRPTVILMIRRRRPITKITSAGNDGV
jgi:hypothetical protein